MPFLITAHDVGQPGQFFSVSATHPGRMIYSENYVFDAGGAFLRTDGFSDGPAGKQAIYSIYRLHFGHFAGLRVKFAYGLLGLALTVVSVTGINVWLARRKTRDYLNDLWTGIVWGTPIALVISALAQLVLGAASAGVFWLSILGAIVMCLRLRNERRGAGLLQLGFCTATVLLLAGYGLRFGSDAASPAAVAMNLALGVAALIFGRLGMRQKSAFAASEAVVTA
jgi:hypothetical protein